MFAEAGYREKFFVGTLIILTTLFNAMELVDSKTVFNELIPVDSSCTQPGEYRCLCYNNLDCNQTKHLECVDGKCACEYSLHRTFDETLWKCVTLVGSMCGRWTPECTRNSECDGGRCLCREGYGKTSDNKCMINFGEECGPKQCNADRGLACKEGRCQCIDSSYVYSAISANCIDPEAVVRDIIERIAERLIQEIFNFKIRRAMRKITRPFRLLRFFGG